MFLPKGMEVRLTAGGESHAKPQIMTNTIIQKPKELFLMNPLLNFPHNKLNLQKHNFNGRYHC